METDYDTDGDGKPDLVKTFVQVPKAAVNGDYKAATIFEASPYVTGTTEERTLEGIGLKEGGNFDMAKLYEKPAKRQATKTVTTEEVAKATDPKDWYYVNPRESSEDYTHYDYENLNWYNYFLVRGYAVVTAVVWAQKDQTGSIRPALTLKSQLIKILLSGSMANAKLTQIRLATRKSRRTGPTETSP